MEKFGLKVRSVSAALSLLCYRWQKAERCHMVKILVVEDEPGIAFGLESDLATEG
jgi:hypothetical protein